MNDYQIRYEYRHWSTWAESVAHVRAGSLSEALQIFRREHAEENYYLIGAEGWDEEGRKCAEKEFCSRR